MNTAPHYILGLDSAMNGCGAALFNTQAPDKSCAQTLPMMRGQAEALVPLAQAIVTKSGAHFQDIGLIVTTIGPGTFTGLRVGMSAAKSFALALGVPLIGVTTLDVLAHMYFDAMNDKDRNASDELVCVLIETKRADYYVQIFDRNLKAVSAPQALELPPLKALLASQIDQGKRGVLIGDACGRFWEECTQDGAFPDGFKPLAPELSCIFHQPDPLILAQIGLERYRSCGAAPPIEPLYLRGADVSTPKTPPRKIAS
ncbi:MAG: tRNA (adenosine(37)-N6)-threonylcarbamoyltransferase complex dimerization subunit type 1 TsaB [Alphaproteobacteria bacterium]